MNEYTNRWIYEYVNIWIDEYVNKWINESTADKGEIIWHRKPIERKEIVYTWGEIGYSEITHLPTL